MNRRNPFALSLLFAALGLFLTLPTTPLHASGPAPGNQLDSWSFYDTNAWTSDLGYAPVSWTNLAVSNLGDGVSGRSKGTGSGRKWSLLKV